MNQQTMPNITLFDLLARRWQSRAAINRICFNRDDTLLAISSADWALTLARLADNEPPEQRIQVDNGQTSIRPREGRPSPLIKTRIEGVRGLASGSDGDFLVLTSSGELLRLNRSGEIAAKVLADKTPVTAFDHCRATGLTAVVVRDLLRLQAGEAGPIKEIPLTGAAVDIISILDDGRRLALAAADKLTILAAGGECSPIHEIALPAPPLSLQWSADGDWLACGLLRGGLYLIETTTGNTVTLADFPASVAALDWSPPANAFFASGAYRIAGWSMETPPLADSATGALTAGHSGFVAVSATAAHPGKPLVAAGYANGRIAVARIDSSEELTIREAGGPVTTLRWSADGRYLAAGDALGSTSIITFPDQIFK